MATKKHYADAHVYESKLARVMDRIQVADYAFDWGRWGADVQFSYKGARYQFHHTVENARQHDQKIDWGSDCFAQIVLVLEDLARMVERGIYDLQVWASGMKMLPAAKEIPACFVRLGFAEIPASAEDVHQRYRQLSKTMHPAGGGSDDEFKALKEAEEKAKAYFGEE